MGWISGTNEALLNEAIDFQGESSSILSSSTVGPFALGDGVAGLERAEYPLGLMLQDGRLLDLMGNEVKGSSGKQVVGREEEMEVEKA